MQHNHGNLTLTQICQQWVVLELLKINWTLYKPDKPDSVNQNKMPYSPTWLSTTYNILDIHLHRIGTCDR